MLRPIAFNEKIQRGTPDFPIELYHVNRDYYQYYMPLHWHREFEIIWVKSGRLQVHLNSVEYPAEAGHILLVGSNVLHLGEPEDCEYDCVLFDLNMLRKHYNDAISGYLVPILAGELSIARMLSPEDTALYEILDKLYAALKTEEPYYELIVFSRLFDLFAELYRRNMFVPTVKNKKGSHQAEIVAGVISWMEQHYTQPVTLAQLAEIARMNEKYLCRLFREFTSYTPIDYLNRLRVENACYEMNVNHRSVTDAAFDSGFNDLSYFSRTFKKYKGQTPKEYRASVNPR